MQYFILNKHAKLKRDWAKNNTITVINTVLNGNFLFITTRWQRNTTNELIKL